MSLHGESDLIKQAEVYGVDRVERYLDIVYAEWSQEIVTGTADQGSFNDLDEVILARSIPQDVLDSSQRLLHHVCDVWLQGEQPVYIDTRVQNDPDKYSRVLSILDKLQDRFGKNWRYVTLIPVVDDDNEPAGWNVRPRGVETQAEREAPDGTNFSLVD